VNTNSLRIIGAAAFLVVFLSGYWLGRSGNPYSFIILTVHKLIGVGILVLLVIAMIRSHRVAALGPAELILGVVSGIFFISLIATGSLLSGDNEMPAFVLRLHQIAPYLTVLSTAATLYLIQGST
jgi:hypothetical protein